MEVKKLGVVGAGQMGSGIAQVAASVGLDVIMTDINQERLDWGVNAIKSSLARIVKKEKITQAQADEIVGRISTATELSAHAEGRFGRRGGHRAG